MGRAPRIIRSCLSGGFARRIYPNTGDGDDAAVATRPMETYTSRGAIALVEQSILSPGLCQLLASCRQTGKILSVIVTTYYKNMLALYIHVSLFLFLAETNPFVIPVKVIVVQISSGHCVRN